MLDYMHGTIAAIKEQCITLDVGLFGLSIHIPASTIFKIGDKVKIYVHVHWNQEQGPSLFGFSTELEKHAFLLIISCSGIGPKIALAVLAQLGANGFFEAVQTGNDCMLSKVTGIGSKKAEQMIVQLKHKVARLIKSGISLTSSHETKQWHDIAAVLESLHYSRQEISDAMRYLATMHHGSNVPFDQQIRHALSFLSKKA